MTTKILVRDTTLGVDLKMWEIDAEEALRRDAARYTVSDEIRRRIPPKNPGGRGH